MLYNCLFLKIGSNLLKFFLNKFKQIGNKANSYFFCSVSDPGPDPDPKIWIRIRIGKKVRICSDQDPKHRIILQPKKCVMLRNS